MIRRRTPRNKTESGARARAARFAFVVIASSTSVAFESRARADDAQLDIATAHADEVAFDVKKREIELHGHVTVDAPPFHLKSDSLVIKRTDRGIDIDGKGQIAFCPCAEAPLTIGFDHAQVAPPGDVFVTSPRVKVEDVTVLAAPWFWLRSPARAGVLPPDIEYRGREGLLLGGGAHLPWDSRGHPHEPWPKAENAPDRLLEIYAAGYVLGGARVSARFRTPESEANLTWDDFQNNHGVTIDMRGATTKGEASVAWDVDALRGARAVTATTELATAAAPFDRARVEASLHEGPASFGLGVAAESARGTFDIGAYGPRAFARMSGSALSAFTYSLTTDGGTLSGTDVRALDGTHESIGFFRANGDGGAATILGPLEARTTLHAEHIFFSGGQTHSDDHQDRDDEARARLSLPFGRRIGDDADPLLHRIEPRVSASAMSMDMGDKFFVAPISGEAWTADAGVATSLGHYASRDAFSLEGAVGQVGAKGGPYDVVRWRAAASAHYVGALAEGAHAIGDERASSLHAELRIGALDDIHAGASVAGRAGFDPVAARMLESRAEEGWGGFVASEGWTTGARVAIPFGHPLTVVGYSDYDATSSTLLDVGGGVNLRDHCGCVTLRIRASHRIGRDGVDANVSLALAPK